MLGSRILTVLEMANKPNTATPARAKKGGSKGAKRPGSNQKSPKRDTADGPETKRATGWLVSGNNAFSLTMGQQARNTFNTRIKNVYY